MREIALPKYWLHKLKYKRKVITTEVYTEEERAWDELVMELQDGPHYMQSSAWGESKAKSSWPVSRFLISAKNISLPLQVFSRSVPGFGRLHYAPQVTGLTPESIPALTKQLTNEYGKGLTFKIETYQPYSDDLVKAFIKNGWHKARSVQYKNTVIADLKGAEEEVFNRFKKRARYEIRTAQKQNVRVEKVQATQEKLDLLATLMNITAKRSGAFFRKNKYSNKYWHSFDKTGQGSLYFVWHEMDLLAGAYIITYGKNAWYKDGGSVRQKSNVFGPRYLQWEIMKDLRSQGIENYDLSGVPAPESVESSSMKGLFTFKTGFADEVTRFMPAFELPFGKRYPLWPVAEPQFLRLYSGFRRDYWY